MWGCSTRESTEHEITISEKITGKNNDIAVVECSGKLVIDGASIKLRHTIRRLISEGKVKIILSIKGVGYIDATGIGELVSSYTAVKKEGGVMVISGITRKVKELLSITRLLSVFEHYTSDADAVQSLDNRQFPELEKKAASQS